MSTVVPWCPHAFCGDDIAWGRWDQLWLGRILDGVEHVPPAAYRFEQESFDVVRERGGVLVLPVGHYAECDKVDPIAELNSILPSMPWAVVFATSDECATFPWADLSSEALERTQLYVQLPRVDRRYPPGTRFCGEGSPMSVRDIHWRYGAPERDLDLFLSAQGGHDRRDQCFDAALQVAGTTHVNRTPGFTQGDPADVYYRNLTRAKVAPAPSGICSQTSFRAYEAAEAGAVPVVDELRPGGHGAGFWEMLGLHDVFPSISDWSTLPDRMPELLDDLLAAQVSARWQQYKREFVSRIHDDIQDFGVIEEGGHFTGAYREHTGPHDEITVVIPTSPVPSNPDLSMIQEVIESIRIDLPGAEILITCDGVRDEQSDRADAYHEYLRALTTWTLHQHNITPYVHGDHLHQSGMLRHALDEVRTTYVLYVEHDCPLVGPVPWRQVVDVMCDEHLNSMRLMHEADVLPEHRHLFLDDQRIEGSVPWMRTVQWSQRPHLAEVAWYRYVMQTWFGSGARTMIEDVMHGVVQHGFPYAGRIQQEEFWNQWRMAVYAPEGSMKRSGHLDGRRGDPKFPMLIDYDGPRPVGGPREGWRE